MSMLGTMIEVAAIDTLMHADTRSPNRQNYNPLRMMQAVLCFEAMEALVGPVAGVVAAEAMLNSGPAKTNTPVNQPRTQQRQPTPGLNLAPGAPSF